ncbi:hypothetical protein HanPSC8_Chr15g0664171 [Helianthus annuus]|nr:hypothetical protein HanPSC8_Chr15g0664171 [Helianthus annuus]
MDWKYREHLFYPPEIRNRCENRKINMISAYGIRHPNFLSNQITQPISSSQLFDIQRPSFKLLHTPLFQLISISQTRFIIASNRRLR